MSVTTCGRGDVPYVRGLGADEILPRESQAFDEIVHGIDAVIDLVGRDVKGGLLPCFGRKNALFAGSEGGARRWAIVASLMETAKLNGIEPFARLRDMLSQIVEGYPAQQLDALLPWSANSTL